MHLQCIGAIFQIVSDAFGFRGELAFFSYWYETGPEFFSYRCCEDEAPCFDGGDVLDALISKIITDGEYSKGYFCMPSIVADVPLDHRLWKYGHS